MAQNDRVYQAKDKVRVYESGAQASMHEAGQLTNDPGARLATVAREHPSEPGTLELVFEDGHSEYISDHQRLRPAQA